MSIDLESILIRSYRVVVTVVLIALLVFGFYSKNHKDTEQSEVLMHLSSNKLMLQNIVADNNEAKVLIKSLESKNGEQAELLRYVRDENKKKDAKMDEIGVLVVELKRTVTKYKEKADVFKTPNITGDVDEDARRIKLAYEMKIIYGKDSTGEEFPLAWAMYFPNQEPDKHWKAGTYPIEFHTTVIESENKDGSFSRAAEMHLENNTTPETKGKEFPLQLSSLAWEKFEQKEKEFFWWNPRLGLGCTFTSVNIGPKLDLSFSSYGKTKRDIDWRILILGIGAYKINDEWELVGSFEPFSWNVGNVLPLVENLFVAPAITYDTNMNTSFGLGVSIPF